MARASNTVVTALNFLFLLAGLCLIGGGVYFHMHAATPCQKFVENSLWIIGSAVLVISLLGFAGSCCRNNFFMGLYLFLMFLLIIALAVLAGFMFAATQINNNGGAGTAGNSGGAGEVVADFSNRFQKFVTGKNWDVFRSCLVDAQVCKALTDRDSNSKGSKGPDFLQRNFSPIQSGCCKPPADCGFTFVNATFWRMPESGRPDSEDTDCAAWRNNKDQLCYNCNSCKAGFLLSIRKQWHNLAIVFCCFAVFTILVLSLGCCAGTNNKEGKYRGYYV